MPRSSVLSGPILCVLANGALPASTAASPADDSGSRRPPVTSPVETLRSAGALPGREPTEDAAAPSQALAVDRARAERRLVLSSVGRAPFDRAAGVALDGRVLPRLELGTLLLFNDVSFELGAAVTVRPMADHFDGLVLRLSGALRLGRADTPGYGGLRAGLEGGYSFVVQHLYVEGTVGVAVASERGLAPSFGARVGFAY